MDHFTMKLHAALSILLVSYSLALAQAERRAVDAKSAPAIEPSQTPLLIFGPPQTLRRSHEKPQDYRCGKDGSASRILEDEVKTEDVLSAKMVDTRVIFRSKPKPGYTLEARRKRKQGCVI